MDRGTLRRLLMRVADGASSPEDALDELTDFPTAGMGFALLDMHRHVRRGMPETVFGQGKTPDQVEGIVARLLESDSPVLVTRIEPEAAARLTERWPDADHCETSRTVALGSLPAAAGRPVLVLAAGTSDLPVAEEACRTAAFLGREPLRAYDVGVAGLHRLTAFRREMEEAGVIIAVAGMEGALPGVVAGLTPIPVIGVPTSIGYGASMGGITPLLTMLSSCSCGLTVVNIDNGYGAAVAAHLILGA